MTFRLARPAPVSLSTVRRGKVLRKTTRKRMKAGTHRLTVRAFRGATLRLSAKPFGERRQTVTRR